MKFQPIQNFDGLSPQTTKGDLIGRTTVGATRVPVGTDNTFLKADSSNALGVVWASPAGANLDVKTLTGATTLTTANDVVLVSGTTFPVGLFSAASNSGKLVRLVKTDGILTPISITGTGFLGMTLCTQNESIDIICDGTTFWPMEHKTMAGMTNVGGMTIGAITSAPTKGLTLLVDKCVWSRSGNLCTVYYEYAQNNAGSAGTGNYLFSLPGGIALDTTIVTLGTTISTVTQNHTQYGVFNGFAAAGSQGSAVYAIPYTATQFRLAGLFGGAANTVSSAGSWPLSSNSLYFGGWVTFPVAGWSP